MTSIDMAHVRPKKIYLAQRRPSLSRDQFRTRWRRHGDLAMSQPTWPDSALLYIHADPIPHLGGFLESSDAHDGIGIILHRSLETRRMRLASSAGREQILRDEDETFATRIARCGVDTAELSVIVGPREGITLYRFLWRRAELSRSEFLRHWTGGHASLLRDLSPVQGSPAHVTFNVSIEDHHEGPALLRLDGVEEICFRDLPTLLRFANSEARASIERSQARFASEQIVVLAVDTILYEAPS